MSETLIILVLAVIVFYLMQISRKQRRHAGDVKRRIKNRVWNREEWFGFGILTLFLNLSKFAIEIYRCHNVYKARVAQLVEPHVANVIVAGSSPVSRSKEWLRFRSSIGVLGQWSVGVMGLEEWESGFFQFWSHITPVFHHSITPCGG